MTRSTNGSRAGSGGGGPAITSYGLYSDLPVAPANGAEAFAQHIQVGDATGPYYLKFENGVWDPQYNITQLNHIQSNPIPLTVPPLLRFTYASAGQDFGSSLNNDGSLWFWPGGGPGTFQAVIQNIENANVEAIRLLVESKDGTSSTMLGYAAKVGATWASDATDVAPPAGGSFASPTMVWAPTIALSAPVANGDSFKMHTTQGTGSVSAGQTFSDLWPTSGFITNPNFNAGDFLTTDQSNNIGIGPLQSLLQMRLVASASPRAIVMVFGDSVSAEKRALADANGTAKEGIWFRSNEWFRSQSRLLRIYSRGQGAATLTEIFSRVRAHLPTLAGNCNAIAVSIPTWNSAPTSSADADSQWADYLTLENEVKAAGFICFPITIHPPTTRNSAGQLAGWARMVTLVTAHGGINCSDITADTNGIDLKAAESADNVHMNDVGAARCAPTIASRFLTKLLSFYAGI